MQATDNLRIEPACPEDAAAIIEIHFAAVHRTAASTYPVEILDDWSPPTGQKRVERIELIERACADSEQVSLIARSDTGVVGFGSIAPGQNELRSLYVHPDCAGQGIGSRLLAALEQEALARNLSHLDVDASLNAEAFYTRKGYKTVEYATHRLRSGQEMACVKMRKTLMP